METQILQIQQLTASELITQLDDLEKLVIELKEANNPPKPKNSEYITRSEVASIFGITLVTVHQWTVKGILNAYKVANRVYYRKEEIEQTYVKISQKKRD